MTVLRLRLTGQADRIEQIRAQLSHLEQVTRVEDIDQLQMHLDTDDSSSAGLAENLGSDVAQLEIEVASDEVAENVVLFAESAVIDAGVVMERVETF